MHGLNKDEAQELRQLMGGDVVVLGPNDDLKDSFMKPLVQIVGFDLARSVGSV